VNEWYESDSLTTYRIDETLRVFGEPRDLDNKFQTKLRRTVMVREFLEGLPPKIYEVKSIPPTWEDIDFFMARELALNLIRDELRRAKKKSKRAAIRERLNQTYANARKRTANRKYPHVRNYLLAQPDKVLLNYGKQNVPVTRKTLVFCLHDHIVRWFESDLRAAGRTFITLTGKTGNARYVQEQFQNNPDIEFYIGNIRAGGVGIDLYAAHHVVFAELDWVPGLMEQAENRAHRRGQTEQVIVVRFYTWSIALTSGCGVRCATRRRLSGWLSIPRLIAATHTRILKCRRKRPRHSGRHTKNSGRKVLVGALRTLSTMFGPMTGPKLSMKNRSTLTIY
jgi:SNF2 family DNA or RNA helicase